ncbi:MAG: hypothetical protein WKG07_09360 [Hymenobacter sp.]
MPMPPTAHRWPKRVLLSLLVLGLLLLALAGRLQLATGAALGGYDKSQPAPRPDFNLDSLYNNRYQPALEHYVDTRIGFRSWLVRLRNQFSYSVLGVARAKGVVVGQDRVLFENHGIEAYLGEDFMGEAQVRHHVRRFKAVQDTLAKRGKLLVFVTTPSKASFMPEYLPAYYQQPHRLANYTALTAAMRKSGANLLDTSALFRQWKDSSRYRLFARGGIHWSVYGAALASDTLMGYLRQHYPYPLQRFRISRVETSNEAQANDDDIVQAMNLLWRPRAWRMAYPTVEALPPLPQQRCPNLLLIGDSFCWMLMYPYVNESFSGNWRFWYYNSEVSWPENRPEGTELWKPDHKQQYLARDIIVVMFTEYNLSDLDSNFSDEAYNLFTPYSPADSAAVRRLEAQLSQRQDLKDELWKQSVKTGKSEAQLIRERAEVAFDAIRD